MPHHLNVPMKRDSTSPSSYIDSIDGEQKELLLAIRKLIQEVEPKAEEIINYGMLEYTDFANLAAQKNYVSLYVSPEALAAYKKKYPGADCGKSCLRFTSKKKFDPAAIKNLLEMVKDLPIERRGC